MDAEILPARVKLCRRNQITLDFPRHSLNLDPWNDT